MAAHKDQVPGSDPNGSEPEAQNVDQTIHDQVNEFLNNIRTGKASTPPTEPATGNPEEHSISENISEAVDEEVAAEHASDTQTAEYLQDLQRLQAEYQNYRKRVDRDRELIQQRALVETLRELVPILDDLDRVDAAGDLENSPLSAVAKKFRTTLERMGLESFGVVGEPFDPSMHEAIHKLEDADVEEEVIADVVQIGYRVNEIELRPAQVAVRVPAQ